MFYSRYIIVFLLLLGVMVFAQPTRPPKLFPKFASLKTPAQPISEFKAKALPEPGVKKADDSPKMPAIQDSASIKSAKASADKIEWITFEQALEKQKTEPRKIYLDVYTEWCGWCKKMDSSTFEDKDVIKVLNEKYYAVKFDAEQKTDILFKEKTYKFVNQGRRGYHELAQHFLKGKMGYPTSVFLDENLEVIQPIPGYLDAEKLDMILQYFGTDAYQNIPWDTYQKQYKKGGK